MPETYFLTVKTEDGKLLVDKKIIGDLFTLSWLLHVSSHFFLHRAEDILRLETQLGSGTQSLHTASSSPTVS